MQHPVQAFAVKTATLATAVALLAAACSKRSSGRPQGSASWHPPTGVEQAPPQATVSPPAILAQPLNQLVAPIALYPDPLVALILPAAANAGQLNDAATYLAHGGDPNGAQDRPWDDSVRSLAHYPQLVQWMAQNISWTQQLGAAFASDPSSVMAAVQALRAQAQSTGALVSTPQQTVSENEGSIQIEPAGDDEIYVPSYDPNLVYADALYGYNGPFLAFSDPWPAGVWLDFGFDWRTRSLWYGDPGYRRMAGGYGRAPPAGVRTWRPSGAVLPASGFASAPPQPMRGAPPAPHRWGAPTPYPPEGQVRVDYVPRDATHPTPAPDMRDLGPRGARGEIGPSDGRPPQPSVEQHQGQPRSIPQRGRSPEHRAPAAGDRNRDRDRQP